jgi:hypothetical protein
MTVFDRLEAQLLDAHPNRARRGLPRPAPRRVFAFVAAAAAVAVVAVAALSAGSSTSPTTPAAQPGSSVPPVVPAQTTVAILSATRHTVPILHTARGLRDRGWKLGPIADGPDTNLASSCVDFTPGHSEAASIIAQQLGIHNVLPASDAQRAAAGPDADVIVVVGRDRTH